MAQQHSESMPGCSAVLHCTKPKLQEQHAARTERTKQWARMMPYMQVVARMTPYVQVVTRMTPYMQVVTRMTSNSWTGRSQAFCQSHSSVLQATRWFRVRTKIMVLHFQDNGETPVGLIRLLWTLACRKRSEQKTQSGCKTKINTALSKAFILYDFRCHPCFPWELGGEAQLSQTQLPLTCCPGAVQSKYGPTQHPCGSWRVFLVISSL